MTGHLTCVGLGYSARVLAASLRPAGWMISGTSTTVAGATALSASCDSTAVFDGSTRSDPLAAILSQTTHLLISAPPGLAGDPLIARQSTDIAASRSLRWIGYLSTVGVYGDHGGAWIDETTAPAPRSERGKRRLEAEQAWQSLGAECGKQVQVFRLPGIYGPGRSALDNLRDGTARRLVKPGQFFNRIHVADIVRVLAAAMAGTGRHAIYNVCDDEPAPSQDVVTFAARLLGVDPPPIIPFDATKLSPMAASFYAENKRVGNARIKADFGYTLLYPTYREGLAAIAAG